MCGDRAHGEQNANMANTTRTRTRGAIHGQYVNNRSDKWWYMRNPKSRARATLRLSRHEPIRRRRLPRRRWGRGARGARLRCSAASPRCGRRHPEAWRLTPRCLSLGTSWRWTLSGQYPEVNPGGARVRRGVRIEACAGFRSEMGARGSVLDGSWCRAGATQALRRHRTSAALVTY